MATPTERRRRQAETFAAELDLADGDALYRGAMAAWSNLGSGVSFDHALSVAGVTLAAAQQATWAKCRHCHAAVYQVEGKWAARPAGGQPVMFCPEDPGGHEPAPGDGLRSFQLSSDPIRYGSRSQLMREVIETDPHGRRSVIGIVADDHSFGVCDLLRRVYGLGREDLAAGRGTEKARHLLLAVDAAARLYAREEGGKCEDYARGQAAMIAELFGLPSRPEVRDAIEATITGPDAGPRDVLAGAADEPGTGWNARGAALRIGLAAADHLRGETGGRA